MVVRNVCRVDTMGMASLTRESRTLVEGEREGGRMRERERERERERGDREVYCGNTPMQTMGMV